MPIMDPELLHVQSLQSALEETGDTCRRSGIIFIIRGNEHDRLGVGKQTRLKTKTHVRPS